MKHPDGFREPIFRANCRSGSSARGFTLIEMLTVISLSAIMLAIALPSFNGLIERYRVNAKAQALRASFSFARAEAIRRGAEVSVKSRGSVCPLSISDDDWSCGWDVQVGSGAKAETLKSEGPDQKVGVETRNSGTISFNAFGRSTDLACFQVKPSPDGVKSSNTVQLFLSLGGFVRKQVGGACPS